MPPERSEDGMKMIDLATFDVAHEHLPWPWIAIDPTRASFASFAPSGNVETRTWGEGAIVAGPTFTIAADLKLPKAPVRESNEDGVRAFALAPAAQRIALLAVVGGEATLVTLGLAGAHDGSEKRTRVSTFVPDATAHAVAFDRKGARVWVSTTTAEGSALVLVDAASHAVIGVVATEAFPEPGQHELHVHRVDDAVLLLVSSEAGTFARVAGFTDGPPEAVPTALDAGIVSAGFVGFSTDGARVHLAEPFALRTHAWPGLQELSSVDLAIDFESAYSGAVLGDRIFVDGHDSETGEYDTVMVFDRSAIRGGEVKPPVPLGMWVGALGREAIVTVEAKGEPARGRVVLLPEWVS